MYFVLRVGGYFGGGVTSKEIYYLLGGYQLIAFVMETIFRVKRRVHGTINHSAGSSSAYLIACSSGLSLGLFIPVSKAVECTWYFVAAVPLRCHRARFSPLLRTLLNFCRFSSEIRTNAGPSRFLVTFSIFPWRVASTTLTILLSCSRVQNIFLPSARSPVSRLQDYGRS